MRKDKISLEHLPLKKEVKAILKPDLVYPPNLIKVNYLRYGYFVVGAKFSKTGKEVMIKNSHQSF
jgi:hypothetical protein